MRAINIYKKAISRYLLLAVVIFTGAPTRAQQSAALGDAHNNAKLITARLDSLNKRLPLEKVYLHLDKPYYNIGDTIWFKSYLVDGATNAPSKLSKILYVELDNDTAEMVRRISIPIKDGVGWGQIPLPKTIFKEAGYTLRAYTNWMQNFGEDYFFNQRFYLGVATPNVWLVKANATINRVAAVDQLQVNILLNHVDKLTSPIALRKVEVKIFDDWHYIYRQELQTGVDGSLTLTQNLKEKLDGKKIRVQIISLEKEDKNRVVQIPLSISANRNIDLQFLPESGKLVAGLKSVIGFKALSEDGKSVAAAGKVVDSKGNEVAGFVTMHNGMGSFEFTPKTGETYTAKLSKPLGADKGYKLPPINTGGTVMHISNPETSADISVMLYGTANVLSPDSACYLIVTSGGVTYYSQKVVVNQPAIAIAKSTFPTGIARFTLFMGSRPLNERAVFIDNFDPLAIKITPDKATYTKRDNVELAIEVKDKSGYPVQGSFSLAVTDDSQVKADSAGNYGMAASLLINSGLKGQVESPGYYINRKDKQAWQALDNLMLTQGWTGYSWADVLGPVKPVNFKVEKDIRITGRVENLFKKPLVNTPVMLLSRRPNFFTSVTTDKQGMFVFKDLPQVDSGSYFIQANNAGGKRISFGELFIDHFKPPVVPDALKNQIAPWYINTDSIKLNAIKKKLEKVEDDIRDINGQLLKQVEIKSKKIIKNSENPWGPGESDLAFDEQDIKKSGTTNMYELLQQEIPGFRVVNYKTGRAVMKFDKYYLSPPNIRIDGVQLITIHVDDPTSVEELIGELSRIKISNFTGVEVMYTDRFKNPNFPTPYIGITTLNHTGGFMPTRPGAEAYRPLPILYPKQFYSPKYDTPAAVTTPDYRQTLYWEPNITTGQDGKARVTFYTSDINGKYTVKIAGLNADGQFGDGTFTINKAAHEGN